MLYRFNINSLARIEDLEVGGKQRVENFYINFKVDRQLSSRTGPSRGIFFRDVGGVADA